MVKSQNIRLNFISVFSECYSFIVCDPEFSQGYSYFMCSSQGQLSTPNNRFRDVRSGFQKPTEGLLYTDNKENVGFRRLEKIYWECKIDFERAM